MTHRASARPVGRLVTVLACLALVTLSARDASASAGVVYALNTVNGGPNQIYGFRINPVTGALTLLAGFPVASGGNGGLGFPEHLAYKNGLLFVINRGSASLSVLSVNSTTGALTPTPYSPIALTGQLACVATSPTSSVVAVGSDSGVWTFVLTASTATVAPGSPFAVAGANPFSCSFSRDGLYVYTGGNGGTTIAGFSVTPTTGVLTPLAGSPFDTGAANPLGYAADNVGRLFVTDFGTNDVRAFTTSSGVPSGVAGNPFPSGLAQGIRGIVHPSGFYMVADRSANQVGVFRIAGSGSGTTLPAVSGSPFASGGTFTDALTLAAGGAFVVAANGVSRNLTTFSVNPSTGALTSLGTQPVNSVGATGRITGLTFAAVGAAPPGDFDGDGTSDISVFRPSTGQWFIRHSSTNFATFAIRTFGVSTDTIAPGDYDGDGKSDPAVYRPSTGTWFFLNSGTDYTTASSVVFGLSTDTPVPGDYDGDRKADPALYRPSTGQWFMLQSSTNYATTTIVTFGVSTDIPVAADFDADGKFDPAVYRPSTFTWFALLSSTNFLSSLAVVWGSATDTPVVGDYDGDGKADLTVFRPSTGLWFSLRSSTNFSAGHTLTFGVSTDTPVPADYDGDSKVAPAIFRPSTGGWFALKSSANYSASISVPVWGLSTDRPINKKP